MSVLLILLVNIRFEIANTNQKDDGVRKESVVRRSEFRDGEKSETLTEHSFRQQFNTDNSFERTGVL
jgi:hypothetical protein